MFRLFMNAQKKKATKKRAFTLVELVVVIVILGVLAGIAALSFSNMTESSKDGVAKANLRAMKSAVIMYQSQNDGKLPVAAGTDSLDNIRKYLEEDAYKKPENYVYTLAGGGTSDLTLTVTKPGATAPLHTITIKK